MAMLLDLNRQCMKSKQDVKPEHDFRASLHFQ